MRSPLGMSLPKATGAPCSILSPNPGLPAPTRPSSGPEQVFCLLQVISSRRLSRRSPLNSQEHGVEPVPPLPHTVGHADGVTPCIKGPSCVPWEVKHPSPPHTRCQQSPRASGYDNQRCPHTLPNVSGVQNTIR